MAKKIRKAVIPAAGPGRTLTCSPVNIFKVVAGLARARLRGELNFDL